MKANLKATMALYAEAGGTGASTGETWQNHPPGLATDTPKVRDIARKRQVRPFASPDVDAMHTNETSQKDNAGFTGKRYRVQDTKFGHLISEHDSSEEAPAAANARPYSRVIQAPEWQHVPEVREKSRKKLARKNPDVL